MSAAAKKKDNIDLAILFGKPGKKAKTDEGADDYSDESDMPDEDESDDDHVPEAFKSAYDEYESDPSAKTMWAMIIACVEAEEDEGKA